MSIPNFKSQDDWQEFLNTFDDQWQCKKALLDRVKDDMFPNTSWHGLTSKSIEVINDIVNNLLICNGDTLLDCVVQSLTHQNEVQTSST